MPAAPPPLTLEQFRRHAQMLAAFNVYRTASVQESLDPPRVIAYVRGLVLESQARVVSADQRRVALGISSELTAALRHTRTVLVESRVHGGTFRAEIDQLDAARDELSIARVEPIDEYLERRHLTRVSPDHAMLVRVRHNGDEVSGRVVDLSTAALAADLEMRALVKLYGAQEVDLEVWGEEIPGALSDFQTGGRIYRLSEREGDGPPACRIVIELQLYPALEKKLRGYVARRRHEILLELQREA